MAKCEIKSCDAAASFTVETEIKTWRFCDADTDAAKMIAEGIGVLKITAL